MWWVWAIGCRADDPQAVDQLVRASMTLRGVRPSLDELDELRRAPDQLESIARRWLDDDRFGATIRDLHAEQLLLRYDTRPHMPVIGPIADRTDAETIASLDEEPLRLIEHVVTTGAPYSDIVTADYTMADPITAAVYGLDYPEGATGWRVSSYLDGRPMAGVLSSTALLQRHMNSDTNHHRGRANLVRAALVCSPVSGAVVSDPTVDDLTANPACAGCHAALDPTAAAFFGFDTYYIAADIRDAYQAGCPEGATCYPLPMWQADLTDDGVAAGMPAGALDGVPAADVTALGEAIASDPRFASCTARRFLRWLEQAEPDEDRVRSYAEAFTDSGLDARELALAIAVDPTEHAPRQVRPEGVSRLIGDLTGWTWEAVAPGYGRVDHGATDEFGFRAMMGGVDGWNSVRPDRPPTATRELALEWIAAEVAAVGVDRGRLADGSVDGGRAVERQLRDLHLRLLGEPDPDLEPSIALFEGALARSGDPAHAWKVVLTAMLLDDRWVTY
ncbi:MAG: DUF1592 domain-containing protein [Myxococcota bacterium]